MPVSKNELEFQNDAPVWLIQLRGDRVFATPTGAAPGAGVFHNPLCSVGERSGITDVSNPSNTAAGMIWTLPPPVGGPAAPEPYVLEVPNADGPDVEVLINSLRVALVSV